MRLGFDGLAALMRPLLAVKPYAGHVFLFRDRSGSYLKVLHWDGTGLHHLLRLAEKAGARFLLTSTSEVYGDPEMHPQREDYRGWVSCTGPRACYDKGKRAAEAMTFDYARMQLADVRVARIFNTYGP